MRCQWIIIVLTVAFIAFAPLIISNGSIRHFSRTNIDSVSFPTHTEDGKFISMTFVISNGPATDCDKIVLEEILKRYYRSGDLQAGRVMESEIRSRGIPIKIIEIIEGHAWGNYEFKTLYNGRQ